MNESSSIFNHLSPSSRPQQPSDAIRPISPQSLTSSNVSRSNTFNTVSSGGSGTLRSREFSPDQKGFQSPRRVLSQKSQRTFDSLDKDLSSNIMNQSQISSTASTTNNINNSSNISMMNGSNGVGGGLNANIKNDWMNSDVRVIVIIVKIVIIVLILSRSFSTDK
jgi:hypothetical protein